MTDHCCDHIDSVTSGSRRIVLWVALAINAGMFLVEIAGGLISGSVSLQADALDFLGDAFNYGISLVVVSLALTWRARAALLKGITMGLFGLWVIGQTVWHVAYGSLPEPYVMGAIGTLALAANATVALMLYRFRSGDLNMRSVWICSRNDVLGNIAVLFAALGVFGTGTMWPDIVVAAAMAGLALQGSWVVIRHSLSELRLEFAPVP